MSTCTALVMVALAAGTATGCNGAAAEPTTTVNWVQSAIGRGDPFYLERLEQLSIVECMAGKGWDYRTLPFPQTVRREDTRADRERRGYGIALESDDRPDVYVASGEDPNLSYVQGLDETARHRYVAALTDPTEGCASIAATEVSDQIHEFATMLPPLLQSAIDEYNLGTAGELTQAEAAWSKCMSDSGFFWPTRTAMMADVNRSAADDQVAAAHQERVIAVADWDCYQLTVEPVRAELEREIVALAASVPPPDWLSSVP